MNNENQNNPTEYELIDRAHGLLYAVQDGEDISDSKAIIQCLDELSAYINQEEHTQRPDTQRPDGPSVYIGPHGAVLSLVEDNEKSGNRIYVITGSDGKQIGLLGEEVHDICTAFMWEMGRKSTVFGPNMRVVE